MRTLKAVIYISRKIKCKTNQSLTLELLWVCSFVGMFWKFLSFLFLKSNKWKTNFLLDSSELFLILLKLFYCIEYWEICFDKFSFENIILGHVTFWHRIHKKLVKNHLPRRYLQILSILEFWRSFLLQVLVSIRFTDFLLNLFRQLLYLQFDRQ